MKQNFKLTKDQQTLVEKNLSIVHWVIVNNIHVNPGICGLEYGDLFQEGCLWLCKAAFTYNAGQAQFSTYAKKVVKNGLLSYCRKICSQGRHVSRLIIGEQGELASDLLYPFRQTHAFSLRSITANMKQMCSSPINASHLLTRQYNRKKKLCFRCSPARRPSLLNSIRLRYNAAILLYWSRHTPLVTVPLCRCLRQA